MNEKRPLSVESDSEEELGIAVRGSVRALTAHSAIQHRQIR